ncbi:FxsA family protein [Streptomyces tricolor]|nr:FxsA family protein [Streptomyces tricolor]
MTTGAPTSPYTARRRRSRLRRYLPPALAAWLVLEIWLLTLVAGAAGGLTVFLLLVAGVVAGSVVIKRAGRRAFQSLNEALRQGGSPARGGGNGLMMLSGLLLMIPRPGLRRGGPAPAAPAGPEGGEPLRGERPGTQPAQGRPGQPGRRLPAGPHAPAGREGGAGRGHQERRAVRRPAGAPPAADALSAPGPRMAAVLPHGARGRGPHAHHDRGRRT